MVRLLAPVHSIDTDDETFKCDYDSELGQFPTVDASEETPQINLEIVLAPLKTLEVCQIFEKIVYVKQTCPKSSFSPSQPILLYGFSMYGPFPNPNSASAFRMTMKIGNTRTNEIQILRVNVFDQKEKFHKFFLTNPMYVDEKDFVNIVSIKNNPQLKDYELGINKKLVDSTAFEMEAYKNFREATDKTNIREETCSGDGAIFVLSSDGGYFYGSDGVRFCVGNHFYQSLGSIYYEKV